ncbi:MAG: SH3 domain-containing protein, partial [Candidatus Magnetominusculus sp. LBB02]|nr:SH3 domain-containing protein [Candidatus Magnetominusculus sp. LBB02]
AIPVVTPTPTPMAKAIPVITPTPTPMAKAIPVITPTPTPMAKAIPVVTPTPTPMAKAIPVITPTPTPMAKVVPAVTPPPLVKEARMSSASPVVKAARPRSISEDNAEATTSPAEPARPQVSIRNNMLTNIKDNKTVTTSRVTILRASPSFDAEVVKPLDEGEEVSIDSKDTEDGSGEWYKVKLPDGKKEGWLNKAALQTPQ